MEADGYVDKSLRTLKGMARRYFFLSDNIGL
jgi:hypothetical protein